MNCINCLNIIFIELEFIFQILSRDDEVGYRTMDCDGAKTFKSNQVGEWFEIKPLSFVKSRILVWR